MMFWHSKYYKYALQLFFDRRRNDDMKSSKRHVTYVDFLA